jgi:hypothetical protein
MLFYRVGPIVSGLSAVILLMLALHHSRVQKAHTQAERKSADNPSNLVYKAKLQAADEMLGFRPRPSPGDADGDFWLDTAELTAGTKTNDPDNHPRFQFNVSGDQDAVSTTDLLLVFPDGITADSVVVNEDSMMGPGTTNRFSHQFHYALQNQNEGLRTLYVKLLKSNGAGSPLFGHSFELVRATPSVAFTDPSTNIVTGRHRWTLRGTASQGNDPRGWLQVRVNDGFVNDHSNGRWWSGYHDLQPGTNVFTAVACNRVGICATSSVVITFDPMLATRMPSFTCDLADTTIVGATTEEISLFGTVDDDNAVVEVAALDASDVTVTDAVVTAAIDGTNWWTVVPLPTDSNLVMVTAKTSGSSPNRRQYRINRDRKFVLEITSPRAGQYINAPSFTVTGVASLDLRDAVIRINGEIAEKTVTSTNVVFRSSKPLRAEVDVIRLNVTAERPGQPPITAR